VTAFAVVVAVKATGGSALDVALAEIGAAFGEAAHINGFKLRVERYLRLGPQHRHAAPAFAGAPRC